MKTKVLVTYTATYTTEVEIEHERGEDPVELVNSGEDEAVACLKVPDMGGLEWNWDWEAEALLP